MDYKCGSWSIFLLLIRIGPLSGAWTEADESRRIAQLKQQEAREFEMQMRGQNPFGGPTSNNPYYGTPTNYYGGGNMHDPYHGGVQTAYQAGHYSSYPERSIHPPGSPVHRVPIESRSSEARPNNYNKATAAELRSEPRSNPQVINTVELQTKNWCFHCASPWNLINSDMQQAMRNLLEIRRARFPSTSYVRSDCSNPKNVSDLPKQQCASNYCQTLVLTDHDSASALTIRGCAEKLGAIDERELEKRGDNTCKRLHPTVDIQECICSKRKFCYGGSTRNFGYKEDEEARFEQCARSSVPSPHLALHYPLLAILVIKTVGFLL